MDIGFLLIFGALVGMSHALEADHLAAVAALSARRSTRRQLVIRGAWWGLGHTLSLMAFCGAAILLGWAITAEVEATLELCVGLMIAGLGAHVLWTLRSRRIHFHAHVHGGKRHLHAHSHLGDAVPHGRSTHEHRHPRGGFVKALAVGLVHGAAGSGALLVLVVAATQSATTALLYIAAFGMGSILGMAALSFIASWPLKALDRGAAWLDTAVMAAVGLFAIVIGGGLIVDSAGALWN